MAIFMPMRSTKVDGTGRIVMAELGTGFSYTGSLLCQCSLAACQRILGMVRLAQIGCAMMVFARLVGVMGTASPKSRATSESWSSRWYWIVLSIFSPAGVSRNS